MDNQTEAHNCPSNSHRIFLCIYIVPVTILNLILLCFIKFRTLSTMREYKMILYSTTLIDFISAWMQFLIGIRPSLEMDMQTYNFDGFLPPLVESWTIFEGGGLHYLAALETLIANFSFAYGVVPFIYRYFAVCWNYKLRWWQFITLCAMAMFLAAYSAVGFAYISSQFYSENKLIIAQNINCIRSMPSFSAIQSEGQIGVSFAFLRITNILIRAWFYGLAAILYTYAIPIFCVWRIYSAVRHTSMAHVSERAKNIQRQISITIGLQTACPLIVTGGSLIFLYIGIKTEFQKELSFHILFYSFMASP
ncbi:hypothetical protein M3Y97_00477100 [Aphelenchoides bicaudatus]|nr:hypothetical protein M3Y97_00477100 [Aphelenchoides bicaudatus]